MPLTRTATQRLRGRSAWLGPGRWTGPVELLVVQGRLREIRRLRSQRVPPRLFLPGLVNAHVHLQIPALGRPRRSFLPWLRSVMAARQERAAGEDLIIARRHLVELLADGVTAVGEIDSLGSSPEALRAVPLAGRCFREVTGFHLEGAAARQLLATQRRRGTRRCPAAWSPHAPYSVSPALFRAVARAPGPFAVHLAEVVEEEELLREGTGPFAELLRDLGRLPPDWKPPGLSPVAYLAGLGLLSPRSQLVHCQQIDAADAQRIAARRAPVVICPGTIEWFRRRPPDLLHWRSLGMEVALGTDSRASNTELSIRAEMARCRRMWPTLQPEEVLWMATAAGGRALGRPSLGVLKTGRVADLLALPCPGTPAAAVDAFTAGERAAVEVWLGGVPAERYLAADRS